MAEVLSADDVAYLTGRKQRAPQIAQLEAMRLPFVISMTGWPWVPRSAIEGTKAQVRADMAELGNQMARFHARYPRGAGKDADGPA